jgi:hypothetical protein
MIKILRAWFRHYLQARMKGDTNFNEMDVSKSKNFFGFSTSINLKSELERMFEHLRFMYSTMIIEFLLG